MAGLLLGNAKIFYQQFYYKWKMVANRNAKPATVRLFSGRSDCPLNARVKVLLLQLPVSINTNSVGSFEQQNDGSTCS